MSKTRYARDGLTISTYAGPIPHNSPNTNSRTMVQITTWGGRCLGLTMDHWVDLVCFIRDMDHRGVSITKTPEVD